MIYFIFEKYRLPEKELFCAWECIKMECLLQCCRLIIHMLEINMQYLSVWTTGKLTREVCNLCMINIPWGNAVTNVYQWELATQHVFPTEHQWLVTWVWIYAYIYRQPFVFDKDIVQAKTSPFSTWDLIWVNYKVVH